MNASTNPIDRPAGGRKRVHRRLYRVSTLGVAVALAVAGVTAGAKTAPTLPEASPLALQTSAVRAPVSFAALVESVQPAVVNVAVTGKSTSAASGEMPQLEFPENPRFEDFFERFLDRVPNLPRHQGPAPGVQAVGSGFIVTADGYIVTGNHVVEGASEIHVVLNDGERLPAKVHGRDPKTDLALLKIDADRELPYVVFGDSNGARPGDWVVAIGNPFGLGGTATTGIISARGRDIQSGPYDDYLQIDAPINRGNSGGPLFDLTGKVIGVNTAIYSPNGGNVGIGFAVPAVQAKSVIEQLLANGHVERGWLGVQIQTLTDALAESLQLPLARGALVANVTPDSPAARAGLEVGDVILSFNDFEVDAMKELPRLVANAAPGEDVEVRVWRQGQEKTLKVSIARSPDVTADASDTVSDKAEGARLGLALAPVTEELRRRFEVPGDIDGALVIEVEPGSPAAREGLRPGDVIVQADGKPVAKPDDVAGVVRDSHAAERNRVLLLVNRQGDQRFVSVQPG